MVPPPSRQGAVQDEQRLRDKYTLGDAVGKGAFGVVHLAEEDQTGRTWACKVVPLLGEEEQVMRYGERQRRVSATDLLQEVELQGAVSHSCITRLREAFIEDDQAYIILEYMPGGDLGEVLEERGSFTEEDAKAIFRRLLRGLKHMHGNGIVHRDLKLENLLLSCSEDPTSIKLSDFGHARRMTSSPKASPAHKLDVTSTLRESGRGASGKGSDSSPATPTGSLGGISARLLVKTLSLPFSRQRPRLQEPLSPEAQARGILQGANSPEGHQLPEAGGTLHYLAPEVLRAGPSTSTGISYQASVDMWAAGVVLYHLLSGYPPFDGKTSEETTEKIKAGRYDFKDPAWDLVSDLGKDLITRLLQVRATERMTANEALGHPWIGGQGDIGRLDSSAAGPVSTQPQFGTTDGCILLSLQEAIDSLEQGDSQ